jgi:protein TonB
VISRVDWARQPSVEFPERAQARGIESGSVSLTCVVGSDGTPRDCSITSEDPAGAGFGQAALSAMRRARFSPRTVDGVAEGGRANFTIRFRLE